MTEGTFNHRLVELTAVSGARLGDPPGLAAVVIAAASAVGLSTYGPPSIHSGPKGVAVALVGHGGHVILHALPEQARCLVDIVALTPANAERGVEVIARRLSANG